MTAPAKLKTPIGQLGRHSPCRYGCHYVDVITSVHDVRSRVFADDGAIVWDGATANGGTSKNNVGQHVESYYGCNLAVYHYDVANGILEQWTRDAKTGVDIELQWSATISDFWLDYLGTFDTPWSDFRIKAFQSNHGLFALYGIRNGNISSGDPPEQVHDQLQVRDFTTGEILHSGPIPADHPLAHVRASDILPGSNGRVLVHGIWPGHDKLSRSMAFQHSSETNPYDTQVSPSYIDITCDGNWVWQWTPLANGRPSFARYNGIHTFGSDLPPTLTTDYVSAHNIRASACDFSYAAESDPVVDGTGRFSSIHCGRIYHAPAHNIGNHQQPEILRHNLETGITETLPYKYGFFGNDWIYVLEDTWPLPDGSLVAEECTSDNLCGDEGGDIDPGDVDPCCSVDDEDSPFSMIADVVVDIPCSTSVNDECGDSLPTQSCVAVIVSGFYDTSAGCPGDCLGWMEVSISIQSGTDEKCQSYTIPVECTQAWESCVFRWDSLTIGECDHIKIVMSSTPAGCSRTFYIMLGTGDVTGCV